ncbi:Fumigermin synthase [Frankliniella fusca]|uniref:Fumigermin synthase n=1 Tax=Frankliniella fusca TaxID=407009 RepID=A0AAE1HPK9_9NEOP|nr:Fumigermin synthase [Frankliniella fusca]
MAISRVLLVLTVLSVALSALTGGGILAAPTTTRAVSSDERSLSGPTSSSSWTEDLPHRRRRHRRSSVVGGRHQADVDALRRLLFGLRPLQDHGVDFGDLEVGDLLRGADGGVAALTRDVVLLPLTGYDDGTDDGADGAVLSAIVTAPRRSRCPPGERYYERRCRKVWR